MELLCSACVHSYKVWQETNLFIHAAVILHPFKWRACWFLCLFACFDKTAPFYPSNSLVVRSIPWSSEFSSTQFNTVAFLFPPFLRFAFKEEKFVFWFLHQVCLKRKIIISLIFSPPLGLTFYCVSNISLFTLDTHCNLTLHSVQACLFGLVWFWS